VDVIQICAETFVRKRLEDEMTNEAKPPREDERKKQTRKPDVGSFEETTTMESTTAKQASNLLTWIIHVCLGLSSTERTSRNPLRMAWLQDCPIEFIIAFMQGVAE